nr:hypothetical protein [Amycolatopsis rubida]
MGGTGRSSGKKVRPGGEVRGLLRQRRQVPVPAQSRQRRNRRLRRSLRDQSRGQAVQRAASDAKNVETDG